jgi:hypothetical protein
VQGSKTTFARFVRPFLHTTLHTVYGGPPYPPEGHVSRGGLALPDARQVAAPCALIALEHPPRTESHRVPPVLMWSGFANPGDDPAVREVVQASPELAARRLPGHSDGTTPCALTSVSSEGQPT